MVWWVGLFTKVVEFNGLSLYFQLAIHWQ